MRAMPWLVVGVLVSACALPRAQGPSLAEVTGMSGKCRIAPSQSASPLLTEWSASEKANLEAQMRQGAVAVAYTGCELHLLPQCRLTGRYLWQFTTPATDTLEIDNDADLWAKLPLGAASLEGELEKSGKLSVQTAVSGQLRLDGVTVREVPDNGPCGQATHLLGALSVGAFSLTRGGKLSGKLGGDVRLASAGGSASQEATVMRSAGQFDRCPASSAAAPDPNCGSPVQAFLLPIPGRGEDGPPGTVKVDFVSSSADQRWDIYANDEVLCSTPCKRWLRPENALWLRTRNGRDSLRVPDLTPEASAGALLFRAHPTREGEQVTGMSFAGMGGMGLFMGGFLALGGSMGNDRGLTTAGLITAAAGAVLGAVGVPLILDSLPRAEIVDDSPR